ncbi:MAG: 50S ribosomal protein L21 [Candidatus Marinimicrobia bacterium]|nr:50S ribosomal protein L21 [Candidatus Neomarinimicrobiota bacterium]MDD5582238.1 50S ribosomal protein L21 [Candidatus Neomarinimicrobiota bacterium]
MYAIVDISGKQYKVKAGQEIKIPLQKSDAGSEVSFNSVMFLETDEDIKIGTPYIDKAFIKATVVKHGREKKIIVFKKKRRKRYNTKNGHRQDFTVVKIDEIAVA